MILRCFPGFKFQKIVFTSKSFKNTASKTQAMIGLGVSSISDSWYGFAQNVKGVEEYNPLVKKEIIPVYREHILTQEALVVRHLILNLMCHFETNWIDQSLYIEELKDIVFKFHEVEPDGLVTFEKDGLKITEKR